MRLTEVRIKLCQPAVGRLKAFCSLTFDHAFVVRDVKLIEGPGGLFLAMPARRLTDHCPRCHEKNHLRARYCSGCGCRLGEDRHLRAAFGERSKLHADIAHPINADTRRELERQVLAAYEVELAKSALPGYVAPSLDGEDVEPYDSPYALGSSAEPSRFRPMGTAG